MRNKKWMVMIAAVLVAGLTFGTVVATEAFAVGATSANPAVAGACGLGLKIGASIRDAGGRLVDIVASATGMSVEDVQAKRQAGESIADIAAEGNVSTDEIVAEALSVRKALLDDAVAAGTITQAQADEALARMQDRLTERVNSTATGGWGMGRQGRGMMNGSGAGTCGGCTTAPAAQ